MGRPAPKPLVVPDALGEARRLLPGFTWDGNAYCAVAGAGRVSACIESWPGGWRFAIWTRGDEGQLLWRVEGFGPTMADAVAQAQGYVGEMSAFLREGEG